jgi:hypothetical protein
MKDLPTPPQKSTSDWSPDGGQSYRETVRQQYNFSPPAVAHEFEDYAVDLAGVTAPELTIVADRSGGDARASMAQLRIA